MSDSAGPIMNLIYKIGAANLPILLAIYLILFPAY